MTSKSDAQTVLEALERIKTHAAATNNLIERKCEIYEICQQAIPAAQRLVGGDSKSLSVDKLELLSEYVGPYGIETPAQLIKLCTKNSEK
jgi:hypothetical protein